MGSLHLRSADVPAVSRRTFLKGASLASLAALLPADVLSRALATSSGAFLVFSDHEAAVVREATARLIPGPTDEPTEIGHPGAREANVVRYIDTLLGALAFLPERVHASGPFSDRAGATTNQMATFVQLTVAQRRGWEQRIATLTKSYRDGVVQLDAAAGGDFTTLPNPARDLVLASPDLAAFRNVMFSHAIEGCYSVPEYGGNDGLMGWHEIHFPGDSQPRGYSDDEVSRSDGVDLVPVTILSASLAAHFEDAARAIVARRTGG